MLFTHNLNPVALELGFWEIRWYGLAYVAAALFAFFWLRSLQKTGKLGLTASELENLEFGMLFGVLLGGRLGYFLFYNFEAFPSVWRIWEGGMSFHGGLLGAILAILLFAWRRKKPFLQLTDALAFPATVGLILGRLANFVNGELPGRPTQANFGVIFPQFDLLPRHPSQLYAAGKDFLIALILYLTWQRNPPRGLLSFLFLTFYGAFRILVEIYWRAPLDGFILGLPRGAFFSVPLLLLGIGGSLWLWKSSRQPKNSEFSAPKP